MTQRNEGMGRMSDRDILDQDRQMLVAVRVRVSLRLQEHRAARQHWESISPEGHGSTREERTAALACLNGAISELETLARMLGIE
jgi:hypothetical protein